MQRRVTSHGDYGAAVTTQWPLMEENHYTSLSHSLGLGKHHRRRCGNTVRARRGVKRLLCSYILQMETPFPIAKLTKAQKVNTTHKSQKHAPAYRTHRAPSKAINTMGRGSLISHTACQSRNSNAVALGSCRPDTEVFSVR